MECCDMHEFLDAVTKIITTGITATATITAAFITVVVPHWLKKRQRRRRAR
jgi:hypothetical protein